MAYSNTDWHSEHCLFIKFIVISIGRKIIYFLKMEHLNYKIKKSLFYSGLFALFNAFLIEHRHLAMEGGVGATLRDDFRG